MILLAFSASILTVFAYNTFDGAIRNNEAAGLEQQAPQFNLPDDYEPGNNDFIYAAERTVYGVVHVKTTRERERGEIRDPFEFFFGPRERDEKPEPETGFGSGVIISEDGYIVTNAHVITGADEIEVTLHDQRTFNASLKGEDPNTDIALLKIDGSNMPYLNFGSSDELRLGEWVLAVGNPFGLTSSVTAGIISAKERSLGVIRDGDMPLESFLQTDAAVNVGNSGGALVNLKGELVGIPTLIISPTRTHIGTAFAVPSSIVQRVAEDIIEFGEVQRGILGISIIGITSELVEERGLEVSEGVFVESVIQGGAADEAGLQRGDVIVEVNQDRVTTAVELQQEVSRHKPGDIVKIVVFRDGSQAELSAELMSLDKHRDLVMKQEEQLLGATFKMVPEKTQKELNLPGGVQAVEIESGELQSVGMKEGFIIVAVNKQLVAQPLHIIQLLEDYSGNVIIEGVYPDGTSATYAFSL